MSYHSELHRQIASTPPELWDWFPETEDGFEPEDADLIAEDLDQDYRVEMERGCDERDWRLAWELGCVLADARLATIEMDVPF